ncbi:MAG: DinB family protein [Planctomycetota bacterium]
MTIEFDSNADLASLRECVRDFRATLDRVGEHLNHRVESVSGWSVAQHLFHVVLATDLGLANVLALVRGKGILIRPEGALAPEAQAVLEAQTVPRGSTQAPRMVVPAEWVERASIEEELANVDRSIAELTASPVTPEASAGWIKHQVLGPLRASHWMRFCAMHARHHLAIIQDIAAALPRG